MRAWILAPLPFASTAVWPSAPRPLARRRAQPARRRHACRLVRARARCPHAGGAIPACRRGRRASASRWQEARCRSSAGAARRRRGGRGDREDRRTRPARTRRHRPGQRRRHHVHFVALNAGVLALVKPLELDADTLRLHLPVAVAPTATLRTVVAIRSGIGRRREPRSWSYMPRTSAHRSRSACDRGRECRRKGRHRVPCAERARAQAARRPRLPLERLRDVLPGLIGSSL
jgi:hypothetical protein